MEYRGLRYEIRRTIGKDTWLWTVYTPEEKSGTVTGDRTYATLRAKRMIDIWCLRNCAPAAVVTGKRQPNLLRGA